METCLIVISFHAQVAPVIAQNIPAASSGLTQPWATVIAAGAAVAVAVVTGVGIRLNHKQHQEKESAAAMERRRQEAVNALVEALEVANDAWNAVGDSHAVYLGALETDGPLASDVDNALARCRSIETKLQLLALDESESLLQLHRVLARIWNEVSYETTNYPDFGPAWTARDHMIKSFRHTINSLRTKYDPQASVLPLDLEEADMPPKSN
ncbi:hypothetical protein ACIQYM_38150 [Rhodococcus erythropolis]